MAKGKKRKQHDNDASKHENFTPSPSETPVQRDLLTQYYDSVTTLRTYVLASLPRTSRLRRKKVLSLSSGPGSSELENQLAKLLDTAIVCSVKANIPRDDVRWAQWVAFSSTQRHDDSTVTISGGLADSRFCQSEIVDFIIWLLFQREKSGSRPKNLLCDGFRKNQRADGQATSNIEGAYSLYPNSQVAILKEKPWPQLLNLLGQSGERIMINFLLDCSVFTPVQAGFQNFYQLSGVPISELDVNVTKPGCVRIEPRQPSDITLVKSRIFYAKPAMSAKGTVRPGFKHIHVLNRCPFVPIAKEPPPDTKTVTGQAANTRRVMMYMFPRQFSLHNVFTSDADRTKTAQKFQDYTMREDEIGPMFGRKRGEHHPTLPKIPKRLRGEGKRLVERLQILHARCSYLKLLEHYCPIHMSCIRRPRQRASTQMHGTQPSTQFRTNSKSQVPEGSSQPKRRIQRRRRFGHGTQHPPTCEHTSLTELATPASSVSAFCRAVLRKLIPHDFWGNGETQAHNIDVLCRKVDHLVRLRRFETMSLHEIAQDFKISDIPWLQQPNSSMDKPCQSETNKRKELFHELLYFVFDSLLMPLIRSNFYVTESNADRNQIFYFRHEVWRHVAEPTLSKLKTEMFEEVKAADATTLLGSRRLGFSQIRLLPKGAKLRPIMNLRRRMLRSGASKTLGPSINSVLAPVHTMLKFETDAHPGRLGSAMFSIGELHARIKAFKQHLGDTDKPLYFAKLDVRAAFDTIPQAAAVGLMKTVPSLRRYIITKHAEVTPGERLSLDQGAVVGKPFRKWSSTAKASTEKLSFLDHVEQSLGTKKKNTVFVDSAMRAPHDAQALFNLLNEHVSNNIVKVGKKFYRQKRGIPQGSVLSSFLCNYFYADLENKVLGFLKTPDCLLLRLIDDFLLVTLDQSKAERFLEVMHGGVPEYGVEVSPEKTLVNFDVCSSQGQVKRVDSRGHFSYCGTLIDCRTLEITKDRTRDPSLNISNSLTVEYGRSQGRNFQRKVLGAFKIQSHLMFYDGSHNSAAAVHESIRGAFQETARKTWAYVRCLHGSMQPSSRLIICTITKLIDVAFLLLTGKSRRLRDETYTCDVRKPKLSRIAHEAFLEVLSRKQARFGEVIAWLRDELRSSG